MIILCRECNKYINTIELKLSDKIFYSHAPANTCIKCFDKQVDYVESISDPITSRFDILDL